MVERIYFTDESRGSEVKPQGRLGISELSHFTHPLGKVMHKCVYGESKLSQYTFLRLEIVLQNMYLGKVFRKPVALISTKTTRKYSSKAGQIRQR